MSGVLAIPDSTAWRVGAQHERERAIRVLQQLSEDLAITGALGLNLTQRVGARTVIRKAIDDIREAG